MAEFPDNSPTLDPLGAPKCKVPLRRRVRVWTLLLLICAIPVGMAVGGGFWVRSAFWPGHTTYKGLFAVDGGSTQGCFQAIQKYNLKGKVKCGGYDLTAIGDLVCAVLEGLG